MNAPARGVPLVSTVKLAPLVMVLWKLLIRLTASAPPKVTPPLTFRKSNWVAGVEPPSSRRSSALLDRTRLPMMSRRPAEAPGAIAPELVTPPLIVPVPVSMPLLAMRSPLGKEFVPPRSWYVAELEPLPTTKGKLLATVLDRVCRDPELKMTWLVAVHLVFVISALLLALSDRWTAEKGE